MKRITCILLFLPVVFFLSDAWAEERGILFHEDFASLDNWKPFFFPTIKKHTLYSIAQEGGHHILKAESSASASAIVYKERFNVYDHPRVKWRWKVASVYAKGDARTKAGDDYPLRVYVMFEYDPDKAGTYERLRYAMAKMRYGEYPPLSSLSYVWSSKDDPERIIESPYTDKAKMVLLQRGGKNVGTWQDQEVNIVEDYQKAFGIKPPLRARIAIMNDSDNTGERSVSYMEFIEVFGR